MRSIALLALVLALLGALAAACGGDGEPSPTRLRLTKSVVDAGGGEFKFTLGLTNEGENAAVDVALSDVWQRGLEVTEIEPVEGQQPEEIGDTGLEILYEEFAAGRSVDVIYSARCRESGEWQNAAAVTSANSAAAEASATVVCP